jgi:hypothetical protein
VPVAINPMTNLAMMAGGHVPESSEALATREMAGAGRRLAHWYVCYVEENPAMPYLNSGFPGFRWSRLDVYERAVAVYQQYREDRLHSANFAFVFRPGDIDKIEFLPAPAFSWRSFTDPKRHLHVPRVLLHTEEGIRHIAVFDRQFRRNVRRSLDLLAGTLQAPVVR